MSASRRPLRTLFALTSMPVGGAETLLANLIARLDRLRIEPEICCLKGPGPLGEQLATQVPVHTNLIRHKLDVRVVPRLVQLLRSRSIDALVTVGAGDKMFWGRLAAYFAKTPIVASALHSTGWPDGLGRLNRWLTPLTDAFIAVADSHGQFLVQQERLPREKVVVIPNGIDTHRFQPAPNHRATVRDLLNIPKTSPLCTTVAALRPEKNHARLLRIAARVVEQQPDTQFLIVGDGPERGTLETQCRSLGMSGNVVFAGCRDDIPEILAASDLFLLTSDNEANPVSIMEAMACELPVIATAVGSIHEMVDHGVDGFLIPADQEAAFAQQVVYLLACDAKRRRMGGSGRQTVITKGSLDVMVDGYQRLIESIYARKSSPEAATMACKRKPRAACGSALAEATE